MACVIPDTQLSDVEKACCREMAHQCGNMDMPNGHSCCQTTVKPQPSAMLKTAATITFDRIALVYVPTPEASTLLQVLAASSTIRAWRHPPPSAAFPSIEILRI